MPVCRTVSSLRVSYVGLVPYSWLNSNRSVCTFTRAKYHRTFPDGGVPSSIFLIYFRMVTTMDLGQMDHLALSQTIPVVA